MSDAVVVGIVRQAIEVAVIVTIPDFMHATAALACQNLSSRPAPHLSSRSIPLVFESPYFEPNLIPFPSRLDGEAHALSLGGWGAFVLLDPFQVWR